MINLADLIRLISEISEVDVEITGDTKLVDDLEFDSLKFIDLIVMLEGDYELIIPEEKIVDIIKVNDILEYSQNL